MDQPHRPAVALDKRRGWFRLGISKGLLARLIKEKPTSRYFHIGTEALVGHRCATMSATTKVRRRGNGAFLRVEWRLTSSPALHPTVDAHAQGILEHRRA